VSRRWLRQPRRERDAKDDDRRIDEDVTIYVDEAKARELLAALTAALDRREARALEQRLQEGIRRREEEIMTRLFRGGV
jgi:hypothetical protein